MKRLSKWFYLGSIIGGIVGGIILLIILVVALIFILAMAGMLPGYFHNLPDVSTEILAIGITLAFLCLAAIVLGTVMRYMLIYRAWEAIQDGNAYTTPGKAVGFLFIPFFNLYWIFRAWYGFARDYNRYIERHAITTSKLDKRLFLAFSILYVCSAIPYLDYLAFLPLIAMLIITANQTIDAVNSLPALEAGTING